MFGTDWQASSTSVFVYTLDNQCRIIWTDNGWCQEMKKVTSRLTRISFSDGILWCTVYAAGNVKGDSSWWDVVTWIFASVGCVANETRQLWSETVKQLHPCFFTKSLIAHLQGLDEKRFINKDFANIVQVSHLTWQFDMLLSMPKLHILVRTFINLVNSTP